MENQTEEYIAYCSACDATIHIRGNKPESKYCPCCEHHINYFSINNFYDKQEGAISV